MKVLCFEGPENVGKTFTIRVLKDILEMKGYSNVHHIHFPSDELCSTELFSNMIKPHEGIQLEKDFISQLIVEESTFFKEKLLQKDSNDIKDAIFIIDRFMMSSLVHQGSKCPELENYILNDYHYLFKRHNILPSEVYHLVSMTQMGVEENVLNEAKRELDKQNDSLFTKYRNILYRIKSNQIKTKYFKNVEIFDFNYLTEYKIPDYYLKSVILSFQIQKIIDIIEK